MNGCTFCAKYRIDPVRCLIGNHDSIPSGCSRIEFFDRVEAEPHCQYCGLKEKCWGYDPKMPGCHSRDRFGNMRFSLDYKVYRDVRFYVLAQIELSEWEMKKASLMGTINQYQPIMDALFPD